MDEDVKVNEEMGDEQDDETVLPPQPDMEGGDMPPVVATASDDGSEDDDLEDDDEDEDEVESEQEATA